MREFAEILRRYRIREVTGDNYGAEITQSMWRDAGITYIRCAMNVSEVYRNVQPLFTGDLVQLPAEKRMIRELRLLETRRHSGGRTSIGHPKGVHDDAANAVCGCLHALNDYLSCDALTLARNFNGTTEDDPGGAKSWQALRTQLYLESGGTYRLF